MQISPDAVSIATTVSSLCSQWPLALEVFEEGKRRALVLESWRSLRIGRIPKHFKLQGVKWNCERLCWDSVGPGILTAFRCIACFLNLQNCKVDGFTNSFSNYVCLGYV